MIVHISGCSAEDESTDIANEHGKAVVESNAPESNVFVPSAEIIESETE